MNTSPTRGWTVGHGPLWLCRGVGIGGRGGRADYDPHGPWYIKDWLTIHRDVQRPLTVNSQNKGRSDFSRLPWTITHNPTGCKIVNHIRLLSVAKLVASQIFDQCPRLKSVDTLPLPPGFGKEYAVLLKIRDDLLRKELYDIHTISTAN